MASRQPVNQSTSQPVNESTRPSGGGAPALPLAPPARYVVHFAIGGDARFLSHHDLLRALERLAVRAELPLRYSQGFNPRPRMWVPLPRPVGVAAEDDLLVLALEAVMETGEILDPLRRFAPRGLRFLRAETLPGTRPPRPATAAYELPLDEQRLATVEQTCHNYSPLPSWPVERRVTSSRGGRVTARPVDLRPLVADLGVSQGRLCFTLVRQGDLWARPAEVLRLLGLDERVDLARLVRTGATYDETVSEAAPEGPADEPVE